MKKLYKICIDNLNNSKGQIKIYQLQAKDWLNLKIKLHYFPNKYKD